MSAVLRISRSFRFEMAHALFGYDGPCRNIHGHSYELIVTVSGNPLVKRDHKKNGMVVDFGELKKVVKKCILNNFDHVLVLNKNSPHRKLGTGNKMFEKIIYADYQPTCENLLLDFVSRLKRSCPPRVILHHVALKETANSMAEWFATDNN